MNLYIVTPNSETHMGWVNSQPRPSDPDNWDSPITPVAIADGVIATWTAPLLKAQGFPQTLDFVLAVSRDLSVSVAAGLIVEWIVSNFKGKAEKVFIERTEVTFEHGELLKVVTETIKRERAY